MNEDIAAPTSVQAQTRQNENAARYNNKGTEPFQSWCYRIESALRSCASENRRRSTRRFSFVHTIAMDRVLKRVGLSKRCSSERKTQLAGQATGQPVQPPPPSSDKDENSEKVRRRRRSKSRRRYPQPQDTKKTRGLFNIDWESVRDCKSCKSRAITRKLCSKRCDNELYRSNSFKFERFVRGSEEVSTLGKKVCLLLLIIFCVVICFLFFFLALLA